MCALCGDSRKPACDVSPDCEHHCCGLEHIDVDELYCALALGWEPWVDVPLPLDDETSMAVSTLGDDSTIRTPEMGALVAAGDVPPSPAGPMP